MLELKEGYTYSKKTSDSDISFVTLIEEHPLLVKTTCISSHGVRTYLQGSFPDGFDDYKWHTHSYREEQMKIALIDAAYEVENVVNGAYRHCWRPFHSTSIDDYSMMFRYTNLYCQPDRQDYRKRLEIFVPIPHSNEEYAISLIYDEEQLHLSVDRQKRQRGTIWTLRVNFDFVHEIMRIHRTTLKFILSLYATTPVKKHQFPYEKFG